MIRPNLIQRALQPAMLLFTAGLIGFTSSDGVAAGTEPLPEPEWQVCDVGAIDSRNRAGLSVAVHRTGDGHPLPVRAIVTGADGEPVDGSGYGLYSDGRFFFEGEFHVELPPGTTRLELRSGPEHVPAEFTVEVKAGRHQHIEVSLPQWFSPRERGWYGADNHVHAQHDAAAAVSTGLEYTVLQAQANGLSYVTEAGSNVDYSSIEALSTSEFVIHRANELRPGPFAGHLNTPGIATPIEPELYERWQREPLPVQQIREEVHRRGGAVIHTHPMTPAHQLHWMGAGELYSDAVMGRQADAMDIDSRHTELLWFSALNLGNRIAATASTDAALGRTNTRSPGDRRVYCQVDELTPASMAAAIRAGRTFATSGGPVFVFLSVEGHGPGAEVRVEGAQSCSVSVEVQSLHPLRSVHLYQDGQRVAVLNAAGERGDTRRQAAIEVAADKAGWVVARAEDENGDWAITSPVYFELAQAPSPPPREAMILAIGNYTRFIELRRDFFAHLIVTVSPGQVLSEVALMRDGGVVRRFTPEMGGQRHEGRTPVTGLGGEYGPGWLWYPDSDDAPVHFQADWPVTQTGWYSLRAVTAEGRALQSDAVWFDAAAPNSHQFSVAHLRGGDTAFTLHGYGEEMPLDEIGFPFFADLWCVLCDWVQEGSGGCRLTGRVGVLGLQNGVGGAAGKINCSAADRVAA
ncbi:MAG: CehA/McbA family metallohydrolase [Opitutales bacterium]